jgi:very-short-patch-repair endonuclease
MVNIKSYKCKFSKCKETPLFGLPNKKIQFCLKHKQPNMINLFLENKCSILECNEEYNQIIETNKYCNNHIPDNATIIVKRLCKYCDIKEESKYICKDCMKIQNKKEWAIVRYLRKAINTKFEYNSSKMLQGCSKKRPDIYFELDKHCVIVEIDEHQHNSYEDKCECARINEIVNGIGGKSVIIIRYNPDVVKNKNKVIEIKQSDRIELLVKIIKEELVKDYESFIVKIIQIYYNDNYDIYEKVKIEDITKVVCI